jgi:hypothetical protein
MRGTRMLWDERFQKAFEQRGMAAPRAEQKILWDDRR